MTSDVIRSFVRRAIGATPILIALAVTGCGTTPQEEDVSRLASAAGLSCVAVDVPSLRACVDALRQGTHDVIEVAAWIPCDEPDACRIDLGGLSGKTVRGSPSLDTGFVRTTGAAYPIIDIGLMSAPDHITIQDLVFDEGEWAPAAPLGSWATPIRIHDGTWITVEHIKVIAAHDIAMWVSSVDQLTLTQSSFIGSDHLGVVVGEVERAGMTADLGWHPSRNVRITNNVFEHIAVNAIVINGVRDEAFGLSVISGNTISESHEHGRYLGCDGVPDNVCGGGVVYLMDAQHLTFSNNNLRHGYCSNCMLAVPGREHEVRGIEIDGNYQDADGYAHVMRDLRIWDNVVADFTAAAIDHNFGWQNTGPLERADIRGNRLLVNAEAIVVTGDDVTMEDNTVASPTSTWSWESDSEWSAAAWASWGDCASWSVARSCGDALDSACALRLSSGPGCSSVCTRSPPVPVAPGHRAWLADWARNGEWSGTNALVFLDAGYVEIGNRATALSPDPWRYNGESIVEASVPNGAAYLAVQLCVNGPDATIDHDLTRLAVRP